MKTQKNCFRNYVYRSTLLRFSLLGIQLIEYSFHSFFSNLLHVWTLTFLVACYATQHPAMSVGRSVGRSVSWLVPFLLFWRFWAFWAYCSCPNALVTFSSTAPAHPHATGVAVYPALFTIPVYLFFMHKTDSIAYLSHEDDAVTLRQLEVLRNDPLEQFSAADAGLKYFWQIRILSKAATLAHCHW